MNNLQWNGDAYLDGLKKDLAKNLEAAAIFLKDRIKVAIGVTGNPYRYAVGQKGPWYRNLDPSEPGNPPHKMLGDLQRSIAYQMGPDGLTAYVGTNVEYGLYLEMGTRFMQARPWLRSTLMAEQPTIAKIVATGKR